MIQIVTDGINYAAAFMKLIDGLQQAKSIRLYRRYAVNARCMHLQTDAPFTMSIIPSDQRRTPFRLALTDLDHQLSQLQGWMLLRTDSGPSIEKSFAFSDFSAAMSFANAVAFLAQHLDHHPDLTITSQCCVVRYQTHELGGLSTWDFECARRIDLLLASAA